MFIRRLFLGGCISCCWPNERANGIGTAGVLRDQEVNQRMTTHLVGRHGGCSIGSHQWQQTADKVRLDCVGGSGNVVWDFMTLPMWKAQ
jgi:hypothetical protein